MDSVHLHIAKIALQPVPSLRPGCAGAVKQHLHAFAGSATTFTSRSPDSQRVCGRNRLPLFHPSITLLSVKAGRTQRECLGGIGATRRPCNNLGRRGVARGDWIGGHCSLYAISQRRASLDPTCNPRDPYEAARSLEDLVANAAMQ